MNAYQHTAHVARKTSPGRLPLLVLLALAVALATLPAADSVHAQGQTTIWSATLTVDKDAEYHGCDNNEETIDSCSNASVLTEDEFAYGGVTYTVEAFFWDSIINQLTLNFVDVEGPAAKAALGSLTLNVDGTALAVSDVRTSTVNLDTFDWPFDPDWTDGQEVSLSLTGPKVSPPGNLHLVDLETEAGHQKVTLTWDAASDAEKARITGYEVQHGTSVSAMTASAWSRISGSNSGTTTHTVTGLTNGTTYYFSIRATGPGGAGLASPWVSAAPFPEVTTVAVTSSPKSGDTYGGGETIQVTVTFSEAVTVTGVPFLRLAVGDSIQRAHYASGSGSAAIVFEHTVEPLDRDTDGVSIPESLTIKPSSAVTIRNADGVDANPNHPALPDQASHKVDGSKDTVAPTITELAMWSANSDCTRTGDGSDGVSCVYSPYTTGHVIAVEVIFSEVIVVTGTPTLDVTIGANTRTFTYSSKGYADAGFAVFEYTVVAADSDTDGISVAANSLDVPAGASIKDRSGNDAVVTHAALPAQSDHKVIIGGL